MPAADLISAPDRDLIKRLTYAAAAVFLFTALFSYLDRVYSRKFFDVTGQADWIWAQHRMSSNDPVAFFAAREFTLPENRVYTHLKLLGDPEYTFWINGREVAGVRLGEERRLHLYDISSLVRTGRNRIVVAVRAPLGVGGLLASIDIAPETENWVVTDRDWKIYRRWNPEILQRDPEPPQFEPPQIVGEPPIGRWNYLAIDPRPLDGTPGQVLAPQESFSMIGYLPAIRTRAGVAVAVTDRARATVFDFGFTKGRVRLTRAGDHFTSRNVYVRFANARNELGRVEWNLRPVVLAPGEHVITIPESYSFRYVMVFARGVTAEVLRDQ
ncbi:MAG TPA: hypothetical protein VF824_12765 [Thermoanaerobaculia bacterium]|jgi:hypothetical protein